ncbi:hypothetical protein OIU78_028177, partial [Salix suchowensis]
MNKKGWRWDKGSANLIAQTCLLFFKKKQDEERARPFHFCIFSPSIYAFYYL